MLHDRVIISNFLFVGDGGVKRALVEDIFVHSDFSRVCHYLSSGKEYQFPTHDVALIKLKANLLFDQDASPVCLPGKIEDVPGNTVVYTRPTSRPWLGDVRQNVTPKEQ